jgi:hypothetical protein
MGRFELPGQRRTQVKRYNDKDPGKRYPSSLAQTFLAVRQFWLQETGKVAKATPGLSVADFLRFSDFEKCFQETTDLYPECAKPAKTPTAIRNALNDMGIGNCDMEYYRLRALAKFTGLTPAALILLFSQLVGEEQRAKREGRDPKVAITQILDGVIRVAEETKQRVLKTPDGVDTFMRNYGGDTKNGYLPDVAILNGWRIAFTSGELPPDSSKG